MSSKRWVVAGWLTTLAAVGSLCWLARAARKQDGGEKATAGKSGYTFPGSPGQFGKRFFRGPGHLRDELSLLFQQPALIKSAVRSQRVRRSFAERVMLVVSGVNDCRYCQYGHSRAAIGAGIAPEEIARLLDGKFEMGDAGEIPALRFAVHFAESEGNPGLEALLDLEDFYGSETATDILTLIRMISLANLAGNTVDALLSRLGGRPAAGSSLRDEVTTLGLMVAGLIPYSVALGVKVATADGQAHLRTGYLVLEP